MLLKLIILSLVMVAATVAMIALVNLIPTFIISKYYTTPISSGATFFRIGKNTTEQENYRNPVVFTDSECEDIVTKLKSTDNYELSNFPEVQKRIKDEFEKLYPYANVIFGGGAWSEKAQTPKFEIDDDKKRWLKFISTPVKVDKSHVKAGFVSYGNKLKCGVMSFNILLHSPDDKEVGFHLWNVACIDGTGAKGGLLKSKLTTTLRLLNYKMDYHTYIPQQVGSMIVYDSNHYHFFTPVKNKIVLQGHGIWGKTDKNGKKNLYLYSC